MERLGWAGVVVMVPGLRTRRRITGRVLGLGALAQLRLRRRHWNGPHALKWRARRRFARAPAAGGRAKGFLRLRGAAPAALGGRAAGPGAGEEFFPNYRPPVQSFPRGPRRFLRSCRSCHRGNLLSGSGIARSGPEEGPGEAGGGVRRTLSGRKSRGPGSFPQISARARPSPPVCHPPETLSTVLAAPCTAVGGRGGGRHNQNLSPPACQAPPPHCPGLHPPAPACIGTRTTPATTGTGTGRPARQPGRRQRQRQRGRPSRARRAPRPRPTARSRPSSRTSCCPRRPAKRSVLRHRPPQQEEEGEDRPSTWRWRSSASRAARGSWGRS